MTDRPADSTSPPAVAPPAPHWPTALESVAVHAEGAVCRRLARGVLPSTAAPGPVRLRLAGLPPTLDQSSLRATLPDGPAGWRVTEIRPHAEARLTAPRELPELRRLLTEAEQAEAALRLCQQQLAVRIARSAELRPVPPERRAGDEHHRVPADALLTLAVFLDERLAALHAQAEEVDERLRAAVRERELIGSRLARESTAAPSGPVGTGLLALVTLTPDDPEQPPPAEPVTVELEYRVPGARWVPSYRLDHRQGAGTGTLALRAAVAQRTGEDWTGVRLTLSTADLHRPAELPELRSIRIGRRQPAPVPSGWREPPRGLGELFAGYDGAGHPAPPVAPVAVAATPMALAQQAPPAPQAALGALPYTSAAPAPAMAPRHRRAGTAAFGAAAEGAGPGAGAPPVPLGGPPPAGGPPPPAMSAPRPMADQLRAAAAPPPPAAAPQPPHPAADLLDYARLTLAGPDSPAEWRGRLHPEAPAPAPVPPGIPPGAAPPPYAVPPRSSAGSFDQRFDAEARVDLPSDGAWHTVELGELPVGLRPEYVCVPGVDSSVYATLLLGNDSARALLAGPLEVTVDDEFLLTTALPVLAPGATRRIGLGVAESVRVTRRTETQESTAGLRGSTTVVTERIHLELANRLAHPVTVEVRERIPVSGDREIKVEDQPGTPAWSVPEAPSEIHPRGTRLWRVELAPNGRQSLTGGYEIRIPAGKALTGGNRRS
ncbi:DUF4139 domain-containing protein [Kitasatospora sp. NBC_01287]|uniref:DUF4139 domain-containing protein n=1 Tax=Kitasatospora sp. NBC_01287 TaxID=2903573 RepID=UPI00225AEFBA|nr:DUF4139 domain-containing protein [Kitasatospora sp. NBC_01287]MCX4745998.1 DUF4139 domain-containing protein [Kitasatospora sp. NBC_01287]